MEPLSSRIGAAREARAERAAQRQRETAVATVQRVFRARLATKALAARALEACPVDEVLSAPDSVSGVPPLGLRLALAGAALSATNDADAARVTAATLRVLQAQGEQVGSLSLPMLQWSHPAIAALDDLVHRLARTAKPDKTSDAQARDLDVIQRALSESPRQTVIDLASCTCSRQWTRLRCRRAPWLWHQVSDEPCDPGCPAVGVLAETVVVRLLAVPLLLRRVATSSKRTLLTLLVSTCVSVNVLAVAETWRATCEPLAAVAVAANATQLQALAAKAASSDQAVGPAVRALSSLIAAIVPLLPPFVLAGRLNDAMDVDDEALDESDDSEDDDAAVFAHAPPDADSSSAVVEVTVTPGSLTRAPALRRVERRASRARTRAYESVRTSPLAPFLFRQLGESPVTSLLLSLQQLVEPESVPSPALLQVARAIVVSSDTDSLSTTQSVALLRVASTAPAVLLGLFTSVTHPRNEALHLFAVSPIQSLVGGSGLSSHDTEALVGSLCALAIYCLAVRQAMLVMTEEEFRSPSSWFGAMCPSDVLQRTALPLLRALTLRTTAVLSCVGLTAPAILPFAKASYALADLLRAVFARDQRSSILPPDYWPLPSSVTLVSAARDSAAAAPGAEEDASTAPLLIYRRAILRAIPFVVPFMDRHALWIHGSPFPGGFSGNQLTVRRGHELEDSLPLLNSRDYLGILRSSQATGIAPSLSVSFLSESGATEPGVDGGGLFKEWLLLVLQRAVDAGYFVPTESQSLWVNPDWASLGQRKATLDVYRALGIVVGWALSTSILIEFPLALPFRSRILGQSACFDDLLAVDPAVYRSLVWLRTCPPAEVEGLDLTFAVGAKSEVELRPGGANIAVTADNRSQYVFLAAHYYLVTAIRAPAAAFMRGLEHFVQRDRLAMFGAGELQRLLSGVPGKLDVSDWRANTVYGPGFHPEHPTIRAFWEVVDELDEEQQRRLLRFATSCSRPPLEGFRGLRPNFRINVQRPEVPPGQGADILPSASTCVNLLRLRPYQDKEVLRNRVVYAISADSGFELS